MTLRALEYWTRIIKEYSFLTTGILGHTEEEVRDLDKVRALLLGTLCRHIDKFPASEIGEESRQEIEEARLFIDGWQNTGGTYPAQTDKL